MGSEGEIYVLLTDERTCCESHLTSALVQIEHFVVLPPVFIVYNMIPASQNENSFQK